MSIRTAFVSTYPPRHCGIATFTRDLASVVGGHEVVALQPADQVEPYPLEVHHRIRRDVDADYVRHDPSGRVVTAPSAVLRRPSTRPSGSSGFRCSGPRRRTSA